MNNSTAGASAECSICGARHRALCPMVKAIEYHPDGSISRVEIKTANDYGPSPVPADWIEWKVQ